jgi:YcxB-like protein
VARINLEVSQADFERASWLAMRKGPLPRALRFYCRIGFVALWFVMCLMPFFAHPTAQNLIQGLLMDAFGLAILSIQFYMLQRGFGREYRRSGSLRLPVTIDVDPNGVHWVTPESDSRTGWRIFVNYSEDRWSFVLFDRGSQAFMAIPKRTLSPLQIEELHVILGAHLAQK